jgi:spore maturation protein CgeB
MKIVFLGLSITSSWGNGHATTYRGLIRELVRRGHDVTFLERDKPWYADNRDLPEPPFGTTILYDSLVDLTEHAATVADADAVIVGSYVPDGVDVARWVFKTAAAPVCFYDIDTPVTLARLRRGDTEYLDAADIPKFAAYLSFTGGPTLDVLERQFASPRALPFYCNVDRESYFPDDTPTAYDLSYLGTYSDDRQPTLDRSLLRVARQWRDGRFCVAGPLYPETIYWPTNVKRIEHLPPAEHRGFYNESRWTLNVTRDDMIAAGWSPSVRLFEAAACATPVVSDRWDGLGEFFELGREIIVADTTDEALAVVRDMPHDEAEAIGLAAREKVLAKHTAAKRAEELEKCLIDLL